MFVFVFDQNYTKSRQLLYHAKSMQPHIASTLPTTCTNLVYKVIQIESRSTDLNPPRDVG